MCLDSIHDYKNNNNKEVINMNKTKELMTIDKEGIQIAVDLNKMKRELCQKHSLFQPDRAVRFCKDTFNWVESMIKYFNNYNLT